MWHCIFPETFWDSSILFHDVNLDSPGYNLVTVHHPANTKRGVVFICFRKSLPLEILNIHFLQECINFEMKIGDKVCNFISPYRSPDQSFPEFQTF